MTDWWTSAANYDLMHRGKFDATMADISNFRNSDKIAIPTNIQPLTIEFDHFCTTWLQDEADLDELPEITRTTMEK
jgi:hypothetical protein